MKRKQYCFYTFLYVSFLSLLFSCGETPAPDDIFRQLESNAKINTFPLTIIASDKLNGSTFPADIQNLCTLSKENCKTLPVAGILRVGLDLYYTYNSTSEIEIPGSMKKDEAALTESVEKQVTAYLSKTTLKGYDSLLIPNKTYWHVKTLCLAYINNTSDSVFFYSSNPYTPSEIQMGDKIYYVYTNTSELRKKIDQIICKTYGTISVFYNPPFLDSTGRVISKTDWPLKETLAGDTCVKYSKYEKLNNGSGGFMVGNLIESNSTDCGYVFPIGLAGDTCISGSKFQKLHTGRGGFSVGNLIERNSKDCGYAFPTGLAGDTCISGSKFQKLHTGRGGFRVGSLIERNSKDCGYSFPTGLAGDTCVNGSKYQKLHNGSGGFRRGSLIQRNSKDCGYSFPTGLAGDTCDNGSKYQKLHNGSGGFRRGSLIQRNSKDCGFVFPAKGTLASGFICYNGSKYARINDGTGDFLRGGLIEANSNDCVTDRSDNRCASRSEPLCEQDRGGNYTGRRIQYCYNNSGRIIQTIVLSRCDSDCRCFGN